MDLIIVNESKAEVADKYYEIIEKAIKVALSVMKIQRDLQVSVSLVNKEKIREINREYRNVDKVTDVLSFPMDLVNFIDFVDKPDDFVSETGIDFPELLLGDIVINLDKIKEQAEEFGHSEERELSYLTVHSVLHLLGYDHIEDEDRLVMREKEKEIMKKLGILR